MARLTEFELRWSGFWGWDFERDFSCRLTAGLPGRIDVVIDYKKHESISLADEDKFINGLEKLNLTEINNKGYIDSCVFDGDSWDLRIAYDNTLIRARGGNSYPEEFMNLMAYLINDWNISECRLYKDHALDYWKYERETYPIDDILTFLLRDDGTGKKGGHNMLIFPAIDLKDGKVVRLYKGGFDTVHQVADDPVATARTFYELGARYLHMVDLDGAKDGVRKNSEIVKAVTGVGLKTELGGGIRAMADLEAVFALGVWRAVIGSAAVTDPDFVREAIAAYGAERIAVGIDAKNGTVRTAGWVEDAGLNYLDFARSMEETGVKYIIFTDIDADGTLAGPSCRQLHDLQNAVNCHITASGGVSCNADLRALRNMGLYAAIVGKAWYAGKVDLRQAVTECGAENNEENEK